MKITIKIQINKKDKQQAEALFKDLGLDLTSAINLFIKTAIKQNDIPFEYERIITNKETLEAFKEGERLLVDKNAKRYSSFKEILESIE
ncbi:type II toxin-antitoxin system RelB/DinJ family antitoxin [Mycoplasma leachii]|uniref:type II toxin-antitoxin system RelB/DinJ family antitoxin n=1 Tax=Mycoplasma leachii TaxID=2105 RepID=UPI003DA431BC